MPFCIIFFVLTILFLICFKFSFFTRICLVIFSVLGICSVCTPSMELWAGFFVNPYFIGSVAMFIIYIFTFSSLKENLLVILLALVTGMFYSVAIKQNLFLSVDYGIRFALIINILPILLVGVNLRKGVICSLYLTFAILTFDSIFWAKELDYVDINTINVWNLMCVLITITIFISSIKLFFRTIRKKRVDNEIEA